MHIGVDFDNTIVCYDALFHKVAREKNLIPAEVPVNKTDVRNHLRRVNNEDAWTEMQGYVYGPRITEAAPYPGVIEFFQACRTAGIRVSIISHKTKHPFLGEKHNLHAAAQNWLEQQGFFDSARIGLPLDNAFFELTKQAKLERIARCGCTHFIDDLPEFLGEAAFPTGALRILFDSNDLYATEKRFVRVLDWKSVCELFFLPCRSRGDETETPHVVSYNQELREKVSPFVAQYGVTSGYTLQPLPGGANNRVYRLRAEGGERALKVYFQNPADPRDRFRAEHAFYRHLWQRGVRRTPEPLGWDTENRLGLFSFVDGRKLRADEVDAGAVRQALEFIVETNRSGAGFQRVQSPSTAEAQRAGKMPAPLPDLPVASEACFSLAEHLAVVERRVLRLQQVGQVSILSESNRLEACPTSEVDRAAATFVREELNPAWAKIQTAIRAQAGSALNDEVSAAARCLSPSDFGFHNALLTADGLKFFDFEYAGWDDPAKLCCDFFCQPQLPVALAHWDLFVNGLAAALGAQADLPQRAQLLLPAYQIKWCCIMLNEFLRGEQSRREFALGGGAAEDRKRMQLEKAQGALEQVL